MKGKRKYCLKKGKKESYSLFSLYYYIKLENFIFIFCFIIYY